MHEDSPRAFTSCIHDLLISKIGVTGVLPLLPIPDQEAAVNAGNNDFLLFLPVETFDHRHRQGDRKTASFFKKLADVNLAVFLICHIDVAI
ncbi:MAG: hypothetical protein UV76_C0008G0037 [Candidatus Nomurabacteria bacterium GW2011_GWA2_43_15]|uniref:Uncharacterized protein n=3 Tax=Candidatus Nomuraibacteriota TaxID=1752729 RepID=A0A0G1DRW4_9BACT|nr:MAG: hypothetical protein UV76_C0008G0037 [Candidatus Nomurabacteria bacterium GW2011_GWA2_43_15]KKT19770.1 MAG: hypothetical protein UW02_C0005G0005 [Candidatus Nomurabacteria bacterium GW2011_GWB1_43_7]